MAQNKSVYSRLKQDQIVFLEALIDLGGEADKSEIHEKIKENNPQISDGWDGNKTGYQITRLYEGNSNVEGLFIVEAERQGIDDNGSHLPKLVRLKDDNVKDYVEKYESSDGFGSYEEAHGAHLDEIEELKERVSSIKDSNEELREILEDERSAREDMVEDFRDALKIIRKEAGLE